MRAAEPPGTGGAAGLIPPGHPPPLAGPRHRAGPAAGWSLAPVRTPPAP